MWTAIGIGAASLIGGAMSADAAKDASSAQVGAAGASGKAQVIQDAQNRADNAQFLGTGTAANKRLAQLLGIKPSAPTWDDAAKEVLNRHKMTYGSGYTDGSDMNAVQQETARIFDEMQKRYQAESVPSADDGSLLRKFSTSDLEADPVYKSGLQFGLERGTEGINARALSSGMYDSGATLKALTQFGNDYGSTKANESYNRYTNDQNNTFNKLSGVSGTGQVASNQVASSGSNMVNNVSNSIEGAGNARAAGIVGGSNAWGGAISGASNAANNYQSSETLKKLLARNSGAYAGNYSGQNLSQADYSAGYY